jgi:hypothetical protein
MTTCRVVVKSIYRLEFFCSIFRMPLVVTPCSLAGVLGPTAEKGTGRETPQSVCTLRETLLGRFDLVG